MKTLLGVLGSLFITANAFCDIPSGGVTLEDFKLVGEFNGDQATFTLTATAQVENRKGGTIQLLEGAVALTEVGPHPKWTLRAEQNRYIAMFERRGSFPVQVKFNAAVRQFDNWKMVNFRVAPAVLQPVRLRGLAEQTEFRFLGAARPDRTGSEFASFLPPDGMVNLSWKEARPETEGKLFYAADMLSQITVSPGLMRQVALLDFKVMQGELSSVTMSLRGEGEVTRVQGDQVLSWSVETGSPGQRRLSVKFNQPQKDHFAIQVQMQTPLGAFPQTADAMQLRPEGATRLTGYFRIVNEGAVRLEVTQATGLSQISPDQFPESDVTRAVLRVMGAQRFAYRFSSADFALRIQADQILPELSVSQVAAYFLGENELAIDAEAELDIREAPLRELLLRVPKGYVIARISASGMSDYFLHETDENTDELRLVYGQPVSGRQVLTLRLERNKPLGETTWTLPRLEFPRAKSVRGHVAVAAEPGFRLTPGRTQGLTEIATAFFPRKVTGIQAAFRLSEPAWQATMRVERLPQTVQADVLHLFSIGEGIAYGSSLINYVISGAPVSAFKIELPEEFSNVEFTGKDIRTWQKTDGGYLVQLHTPVSGTYALLATYDRTFNSHGETLTFTGARPTSAQSEQGYTLIVSAYQFQVKPTTVSSGLLTIEPGEVPPEYRLFFDAPILAAYRYSTRPFDLKLALSPLAQGDSLSQVVDRASLTTRISKEGQVITDARYFVKNRGNPNFRLTLPPGVELWSAMVNGSAVVPVTDAKANLVPLPQHADPNAVLTIDLKLAAVSKDPKHVPVAAPILNAPVMFAEWTVSPDTGQRLAWSGGSLTPTGGVPDNSGFAGLARAFTGPAAARTRTNVFTVLGLLVVAVVVWRWACGENVQRNSPRHVGGALVGVLACGVAIFTALSHLDDVASPTGSELPKQVTMVAPVQQTGSSLSVEVLNVADTFSMGDYVRCAWPAALAVVAWLWALTAAGPSYKTAAVLAGWLCLGWAVLRCPNGAPIFVLLILLSLLIHVIIPALRRLWQVPRSSQPEAGPAAGREPAAAVLIGGGLLWLCMSACGHAQAGEPLPLHPQVAANQPVPATKVATNAAAQPVADMVVQDIRIEENFAIAHATIRWTALKGQSLPVLYEPAVFTSLRYNSNQLDLVGAPTGFRGGRHLVAQHDGNYTIEVDYQMRTAKRDSESGLTLPVQAALINRLRLTVENLDVDVLSPQAVSVIRNLQGSNTVAELTLSPASDFWIGWKPRSRDVRREKAVFYAEVSQVYVPSAGVVEGAHLAAIRPAQGELSEIVFDVPRGATITDVTDPFRATPSVEGKPAQQQPSLVGLWRFDPDARKLRVTLNPPQSRPFTLLIRSQAAAGTLPFDQSVGVIAAENAAGQIGLLGVATGNEVQLDNVSTENLSPINLEDFPAEAAVALAGQFPGLTVRRAFRYSGASASASLRASAVEPDVRVETQDTLSLGEDRTVLAETASVEITRAGIFRLSFVMPAGFDVEAISGQALSHWTELRTETGRVVTIHLNGKTLGAQQFSISLAGPGVKSTNGWAAPQLTLREASKQVGTLLVVPEQGMRLQASTRDGVTQLDPQKSGIRQKGVLAFRLLQSPWNLSLDIEQVDPWIQVTSLQHATIGEAQIKVVANLLYQIENTGLKAFRVYIPTNAEGVRFTGDQVADFLALDGAVTNGLQEWEIKLHRRVIGSFRLQISYQTLVPEQSPQAILRGIQAADVNLQRGFVTIQSGGRLQARVDNLPAALQPAEYQSIPRALQQDLSAAAANFSYRLVEPAFQLPLQIERHEATKLLEARVNNVTLTSVISDDGVMLTQARLELSPGDKRLLNLTLPKDSQFWFAFVNQNGVWPWREGDKWLIPLDQPARGATAIPVEFFYTCKIGSGRQSDLDMALDLAAPKFDLPLENITWRVSLSEKWHIRNDEKGSTMQLYTEELLTPRAAAMDSQSYLSNEALLQKQRTKAAEDFYAAANSALGQGDPQQARRSFQAAWGLSSQDTAFNEDARVQLHNIKLQQALVGLNVRQAASGGDNSGLAGKLRDLRGRKEFNYTQQDAKDMIERNSADDNASYMRLAERLIQQQDAAVTAPAAIRATLAEQGRVLTFKRAVLVDPWASLKVELKATAQKAASWAVRVVILGATFAILLAFALASRRFRRV
jgi:hypothetical protein